MSSEPARLAGGLHTGSGPVRVRSQAAPLRPLIPAWVHGLLPLLICALWALSIGDVQLRDMTDVGLVSVMPRTALLLLVLLTASFCLSLRDLPLRPWVALAHVLVLIVMLYGVTGFLESQPRFSSVYRHVGIIDHLIRYRVINPNIDAYFNWPGFFALGSMVTQVMGVDPLSLASWGSLVFNLLFLAPLVVIFRWASDDPRVTWLGLWVFYSANWVGQDYLSPQVVAYTLWLTMLAALLTWFTPRPDVLASRSAVRVLLNVLDVRRMRERLRREARAVNRDAAGRAGLVIVLVLMFTAIVSGHQLTPFPALLAVTALVLFAGLETRRLPILMGVILAAWISYQTTTYLKGHFGELSGPLGSTSQNLTKNVSSRVTGSSDHAWIVQIRLYGSATIWALGMAGAVRRLAAKRVDIAFVVIGTTPFVLPILQPYGGEMLLRVFLFALPVVAFFIAALAFPTPSAGLGWPTTAAVAVICCMLLGLFQFMRYGNERLDYFTPGDAAAVREIYRYAPQGSTLIGGNLPWRHRHYADYHFISIFDTSEWHAQPEPRALVAYMEHSAAEDGGVVYVILTRSLRIQSELLEGRPGVIERVTALLRRRPTATELYSSPDGDVFRVAAPVKPFVARHDPVRPATRRPSASDRRSAGTPRLRGPAAGRRPA